MPETVTPEFPNLEDDHTAYRDPADGFQFVVCTVDNPDTGQKFVSSYSPNAEGWEVQCLFCEEAERIKRGEPQFDHGCYDSGDREEGDEDQLSE